MTRRRTPVSRMLEGLEPEKMVYMGPVYAASSMPQGCPQIPVVWKRFKEEKTLPVGMVFITKVPSGYGYFFFNVCHVEEEMVLVSNVSLGYRKGEPGSEGRTYVGRYRSNFSTYQGLTPSEVHSRCRRRVPAVGGYPGSRPPLRGGEISVLVGERVSRS